LIEPARHRDDATVAGSAPHRHSQPGVLDVKRLHRGFVKSWARQQAAPRALAKIEEVKKASSAGGT
jgi:hypothetical protein